MKNYRNLDVWSSGHALALSVYLATKKFPKEEQFGVTSQLRRASASVPANIAEGCGRQGDAELRRFMNIALGSACELDYFILLAHELGYIDSSTHAAFADAVLRLRKQLGSFIKRLRD